MKQIKLTQNRFTLVNDSDFEYLNQWKWHYNSEYAVRVEYSRGRKNPRKILLHRLINQTPDGFETDHINGDKLDNRRENLRTVTNRQNQLNSKKYTKTSPYKGVYKHNKIYVALIKVNHKTTHLGCFDDPIEAAQVYNEAVKKYYGEYGRLNII